MERKIGEVFEYNGEWYQCIEGNSCKECDFKNNNISGFLCHVINVCLLSNRADKKQVIFKKLEKIGEPISVALLTNPPQYVLTQKYKVVFPVILPNGIRYWEKNSADSTVTLEIKQTKEDMEEKKLNLKPFDIQKASPFAHVTDARQGLFALIGNYVMIGLIILLLR